MRRTRSASPTLPPPSRGAAPTRAGAIALALFVGATVAASSVSAHPTGIPTMPTAAPSSTAAEHVSKLPWESGMGRVVPGEIVVVWRRGVPASAKRSLAGRLDTSRVDPVPGLGVDVVRVPAGRSVHAALRNYRRSPLVRIAEPNRLASVAGVPTDALFAQQWGLHNTGQSHETADFGLGAGVDTTGTPDADVDAPEAWDALTVHASVTVAVIDTGVDIGHPDLAPNVVPGKDFVDGDAAPTPASGNIANSHGTHVAGIVAAESNDAVGMAGVCPDCRIMGLRIGNFDSLTLGREVKAINWAVNHGADVINLSLGSPIWSKSERNAIARAGKNGVLVVVAAGNVSSDNDIAFYASDASHAAPAMAPSYPASYTLTNILTVAASNDRDQYAYSSQCRSNLGNVPLWRCAFTSWGHDSVDVAAPGVDILSTVKEGQGPGSYADHDVWDGTSMASPLVAGIAGLVLSEHPAYSPNKAKNAIMNSANHPTMLKLYDSWADVVHVAKQALSGKFTRTQGRVNALRALTGSTANATRSTDGNIDGAASIASRRHGSVTWPADANDVFRKRLVKGNRYEVELNGPQGRDFDLWVWRPGTKEIFQFTSGCFTNGGACPALQTGSAGGTADERVVLRAGKTGVFFIHVNGWYSSGGYTLTIRQL